MGCGGSKTKDDKPANTKKEETKTPVNNAKQEEVKKESKPENDAHREKKEDAKGGCQYEEGNYSSRADEDVPVRDEAIGGGNGASPELIQEALDKHNELRALHGCPPLVHNQELSDFAQAYADKIAGENNMAHSDCQWGSKRVGENLAWCSGMPMTGTSMTQMWYDEIKDYDFSNGTFTMETGHFTQVVWKETQEIGIGLAQSSDGGWYGVANYYPAGNMMGAFDENVPNLV